MADSIIGAIVSPIVDAIVTPLVRQFGYLFKSGSNIRNLKKLSQELGLTRDEVQEKIVTDTSASDEMVPTERVKEWLNEVRTIQEDVMPKIDADCNETTGPMNCWSSYRISKRAAKAALQAKELIDKKEKFDVVTKRSVPPIRRMITLPDATPSSTEMYLSQATGYIQDDEVRMVAIWGMGGVGKTTLLQRINNHPSLEPSGFDYVIWLVASQDLNIDRLQRDTAKRIGLELDEPNKLTVGDQALKLHRYLEEKRCLLLLDDIWEPLDLAKIGIHGVFHKGKVVFTTRSEDVCDQTMAYSHLPQGRCRNIKVQCLPLDEARRLFLHSIGEGMRIVISSDERIGQCVEEVVDKCGGLPLALVVIARAMSANKTLPEWKDAIHSLNTIGIQEMWRKGDDPFPLLKVSYDRLPNDGAKKLFLSCALWPEDHVFALTDRLLFSWLGMNVIDYCGDISATYRRAYTILQRLKRACLLEQAVHPIYEDGFKMHDILRGMALWIASSEHKKKWMVTNRASLKDESADATEWEAAEIISLSHGRSGRLPQQPFCPNLTSLILKENEIGVIPEGFFQNMNVLTFLDLSYTIIHELPLAICRLSHLRHLNLSGNDRIRSLPLELGNLEELRALNLRDMSFLKSIPKGLISRLEKLEYLDIFDTSYDGWDKEGEASIEELVCSRITTLSLDVMRLETVEQLSKSHLISLWSVEIRELEEVTTLPLQSLLQIGNTSSALSELRIKNCKSLEEILIDSKCEESFDNLEGFYLGYLPALMKINFTDVVCGSLLRNTRSLTIVRCFKLKGATWIMHLPYLESLSIEYCFEMEHVIGNEGTGDGDQTMETEKNEQQHQNLPLMFTRLNVLRLISLANMSSFSTTCAVAFPSLKDLRITDCPKLDEAPFSHLQIRRR